MGQDNLLFKDREGNLIASVVISGIIILFLAVIVFVMPEPNEFQRGVLRFFIAIAAGMLASFFLGGVVLQGTLAGSRIGAGGGFALFILIQFVFDPLKIQTITADVAPQLMSSRQEIREIQAVLAKIGAYKGEIDGIPGTSTRNAIKNFQAQQDLPLTGYIDAKTQGVFNDAEELTSAFEGQQIVATGEQKTVVLSIISENGLHVAIALPIIFDTVENSGAKNSKAYAESATKKLGGSPITGVSERLWLLAFLDARENHIVKVTTPIMAKSIIETRISKFRSEVQSLKE